MAVIGTRSVLGLLLFVSGCASVVSTRVPTRPPRSTVVMDPRETKHCLRLAVGAARTDEEWAVAPTSAEDESALADVPPRVRRTARAAGLEPRLAALIEPEEGADPTQDRMSTIMRLSSLEIELSAVLFEADCVGDQMESTIFEIERRARRQEIGIAVASVVVGATAAIGSGAWDIAEGGNGPIAFAITGGAISAILGGVAFAPRRDRVVFQHERNLLAPIVTGEDPNHLYPTFVFYLLTHAAVPGQPTPREEIIASWQAILDEEIDDAERPTAEAVLYGTGGVYDSTLVHVREQLFDVLESHLNAMQRDLELLYAFVGDVIAQ